MGLPLLFLAAILIAAAARDQLGYLAQQRSQDIKGFLPFGGAMAAIGAIGMVPTFRQVSNALFFLVVLVLLVANKGIFQNIASGQAFTPVSPPSKGETPVTPNTQTATPPGVQTAGSQVNPQVPDFSSNVVPFAKGFGFGPFTIGNIPAGQQF